MRENEKLEEIFDMYVGLELLGETFFDPDDGDFLGFEVPESVAA